MSEPKELWRLTYYRNLFDDGAPMRCADWRTTEEDADKLMQSLVDRGITEFVTKTKYVMAEEGK